MKACLDSSKPSLRVRLSHDVYVIVLGSHASIRCRPDTTLRRCLLDLFISISGPKQIHFWGVQSIRATDTDTCAFATPCAFAAYQPPRACGGLGGDRGMGSCWPGMLHVQFLSNLDEVMLEASRCHQQQCLQPLRLVWLMCMSCGGMSACHVGDVWVICRPQHR
jgi:hypothetical protein